MAHSSLQGSEEVVWRVVPATPPRIVRHCPRCRKAQPFASTDRFRINAQQRHLDVWLIYQCSACEERWKRQLFSRRAPEEIGDLYQRFLDNDPATARHFAFAPANGFAIAGDGEICVERSGSTSCTVHRIRLEVPFPCELRLERLLAKELDLSRSRVRELAVRGVLDISPGGAAVLRRAIRDGTRLSWSSERLR